MISEEQLAKLTIIDALLKIMPLIRQDFTAAKYKRKLTAFVTQAKKEITPENTQVERFNQLHYLFYTTWGFKGPEGAYQLSNILWLDKVINARSGSTGIVGALFVYIAGKLAIDVSPLTFPDQMLLRIDLPDQPAIFMHPTNGVILTMAEVKTWITGAISPFKPFDDEILYPERNLNIVIRLMDMLKTALIAEQSLHNALKISEFILMLYPDDPYERRDRGLIYANIGCSHIAADDLDYFVEQCPNDPLVEVVRQQRSLISPESIIFH